MSIYLSIKLVGYVQTYQYVSITKCPRTVEFMPVVNKAWTAFNNSQLFTVDDSTFDVS